MATLATLRAKLNGEIGVTNDADTTPWTTTVRNNAIIDGYAALWRVGVWKYLRQDLPTVDDQALYNLTSIRRLGFIELIDSSSRLLEMPVGATIDDGSGAYQLRLMHPIPAGNTIRVHGWTAYKSQFSGDGDTDDLPAEHNRIPLLKAKAILYRTAMGKFARTGERQALPPEMNVSTENLLAIVAAAEREFAEEARALARLRPRVSQSRRF